MDDLPVPTTKIEGTLSISIPFDTRPRVGTVVRLSLYVEEDGVSARVDQVEFPEEEDDAPK